MKQRHLSQSDQWATPSELYNCLHEEFHFDFDPCPLYDGPITPENDGLKIPWGQSNFVNPPYTRHIKEAFVHRAVHEMQQGKTSVLLLPVSTSTALFHDWILPHASEIRFLRGRVKFVGKNTKGELVQNKTGMHDSMIVVFKGKVR